jgi:hypothetical protein
MSENFPRRNRLDLLTPAEKAIWDAMQAVEAGAADMRLTRAVVLLGEAREWVADFVDGVPREWPQDREAEAMGALGRAHAQLDAKEARIATLEAALRKEQERVHRETCSLNWPNGAATCCGACREMRAALEGGKP